MASPHSWLRNLAGKFIVFEGPDGSGKTTQFRRVLEACKDADLPVCDVREPGGTLVGGDIRDILLDPAHSAMSLRCEMLLYMASRAQLVEKVISPAMEVGRCVLADRFVPSTLAYQGAGGGLPVEDILAAAKVATMGLQPDLVVIYDVDEQTAAKRLGLLLDRMEAKGLVFHRKVREGYLELARADPRRYRLVDGSKPEQAVWDQTLEVLQTFALASSSSPRSAGGVSGKATEVTRPVRTQGLA